MRNVCMMRGLFMIAGLMVFGCFLVVRRGVPMMFCRLLVVFGAFVLSHLVPFIR